MKILYAACFFLFLFFSQSSNAQLTIKDFKLCIENIGCSDSVLKISKQQLLKAGKVTPNFSWFTIKSVTIYIGGDTYLSDVITTGVKGDTIDDEVRKYFQRAGKGTIVTFNVNGVNKRGKEIEWGSLTLIVVE